MNRATRAIVATVGAVLGLTGIDHGFLEILQGNTPPEGLVIDAIGPAHIMWAYGGEAAFTSVPNFLATGILAVLAGIAVIVCSLAFIHRKHGPTVFALLFALLFLVGGGIAAPVVFVPPTWAAARIHAPLAWWGKVLPESLRRPLARIWPGSLVTGVISLAIGLYITIAGHVPGVDPGDPERILAICWAFVFGGGWGMFLLTFVAGFAHDIQSQMEMR
jgi:hypothetical protein